MGSPLAGTSLIVRVSEERKGDHDDQTRGVGSARGSPDARSRPNRSCKREGSVRDRPCGLSGQGGAHDRGVISAGRTRHRPPARRPCVRLLLEGGIVRQLKGKPAVRLKAGQTFYEGPADIHVVGRNASSTAPARFVVVLLRAKGTSILTPVKE